ncbi:hypothetical protein [Haematobacter sp.]|uniref:hypothetical protein n=1 Tax=Haematobacter sp. TaxID=2953762 RepID=UPI0028AC63AE|nr:hypothetical protein [Haematobacter sp.]
MPEPGPDWAALGRVFAALPNAQATASPSLQDDDALLTHELAEERAAIMEYDGGLPRAQAETLARRAHGLASAFRAGGRFPSAC